MVARKLLPVLLFAACFVWTGNPARAEDSPLTEMEPEIAKEYGGKLVELFTKTQKDLPVKIDADAEKAVGLLNPNSHQGIILVPLKGFREDRDAKDSEKDRGVGLCYIFMSGDFNPLVDGKPATDKQLRKMKFKTEEEEREVTCLICSVKKEGDDYLLNVFSASKEPLSKSSFEEATDAPKAELALTIKDVKDNKATLVINMFGKYCVTIPISHNVKTDK
ncbi:MAG TPA: hypothetical protein VFG04_28040 [Planctomycetaceae bacterium]|jgi:hypothetical protein|nr:hypothetical protein [Planctomycetaceae bacterium]